ncbi:hypothetical protein BGZ92_008005 [Podila epicladia]|nr:hypothetical protein BGZ92_008005 [Podila epicladia]
MTLASVYKTDYVHLQLINNLGAWMTNFILIFFIKFFFGIIPGISPELSWTLTTLTYNIFNFRIVGWEDMDLSACGLAVHKDQVERMDNDMFLLSTHYTHYAPFAFFVNFAATAINLIAKLPAMHQVRLFNINQKVEGTTD